MSTIERLQQARALIADPEHWTRFKSARDADGNGVLADDPRAVCWCAMGAVLAVGGWMTEVNVLSRAAQEQYGAGIGWVNDERDHSDVLLVFDTAIEKASER